MSSMPTKDQLKIAFVIGRLGEFTTPTELTEWLIEVSFDGDWFENAVELIAERLK